MKKLNLMSVSTRLLGSVVVTSLFSATALAATPANIPPANGGGTGLSFSLKNPLTGFPTIQDLLLGILDVVIIIATPIVVLFIIFAGFKYVTARGNPSKVEEAHNALTYAIIGGILIIGAKAVTEIIKNLVNSFA